MVLQNWCLFDLELVKVTAGNHLFIRIKVLYV